MKIFRGLRVIRHADGMLNFFANSPTKNKKDHTALSLLSKSTMYQILEVMKA